MRHGRIHSCRVDRRVRRRPASLALLPSRGTFRVRRVGQVAQDDQGAPGQAGKRSDVVGSASDGSAGGVATRSEERRSAEGGSIGANRLHRGWQWPNRHERRRELHVEVHRTRRRRGHDSRQGPRRARAPPRQRRGSHSPCTATPKIPGWIVVWFAPVPRRAAGRSALTTTRAPARCASRTAGAVRDGLLSRTS